ncbi:lysozyme [bacterium]|nr:lysozyme [bacterium]
MDDFVLARNQISSKNKNNTLLSSLLKVCGVAAIRCDSKAGVATVVLDDKRSFSINFKVPSKKTTQKTTVSKSSEYKNVNSLRVNDAGFDIIKDYESLRLNAYKCPAGVPTIGYGHTKGVKMGQKISKKQALNYLKSDVQSAVDIVRKLVKVPLTQNQFSALVSFVFNVGEGNFSKSTMLTYINKRQYAKAANEFAKWNKASGSVQRGLVRRRESEKNLFMA